MSNAFLVRPLALGTVSSNDGSAAGTLPAYLDNDFIGMVHRGTSLTAGTGASVDVDFGSAQAVDTAAFLSAGSWPANLAVTAGTSAGGATLLNTSSAFVAGSALPSSGRQNSLLQLGSAVTARYWRFAFDVLSTPFEAGRLVLGAKFQPVRNFSFGAAFATLDRGSVEWSRSGVQLVTDGARQRSLGLSFQRLTQAEAEGAIADLLDYLGNTRTVMIVVNGDADAQRSRRIYFGYLTGDLTRTWRVAGGWEWRCNLVSLV